MLRTFISASLLSLIACLNLVACGGNSPAPDEPGAQQQSPKAGERGATQATPTPRSKAADRIVATLSSGSLTDGLHQKSRIAYYGLAETPEFELQPMVTKGLEAIAKIDDPELWEPAAAIAFGIVAEMLSRPLSVACGTPEDELMMELASASREERLEAFEAHCRVNLKERFGDLKPLHANFIILAVALEEQLALAAPLQPSEQQLVRLVAQFKPAKT